MVRDPIVAEVRAIREALAKRFNYDLDAIYRHLKEQEQKSGRMTVSFSASNNRRRKKLKPGGRKGRKH